MFEKSNNIVSVQWLNENLKNPELIVLDATMKHRPNGELIEPPSAYIPGAIGFNFDTDICDRDTELPHMVPPLAQFEQSVRNMGIDAQSIIVIYDAMGIFSSPRAWWMFKLMGHQQVYVLNGGLPKWQEQGFATQKALSPNRFHGNFKVNFKASLISSAEQVFQAISHGQTQIIDARSKARFEAQEPEPRKGLSGGHIPGSHCLPFDELLANGLFKSQHELKEAFKPYQKQDIVKTIFSCGSGVTASILALAADEVGLENYSVYDGSWSEWAGKTDFPVEPKLS